MRLGAKVFGALAGALLLFLLVGALLPGTWEAESEILLPASPASVFPFLNRPDRWVLWNAMPESGFEYVGPEEGVGAGFEWDDPSYGTGSFRVLRSHPERSVEYEVLIEGGSLTVIGALSMEAKEGGTHLRWTEKGDFGRSPLMGYTARGMAESQSEAMGAKLDSLAVRLKRGGLPPTLP